MSGQSMASIRLEHSYEVSCRVRAPVAPLVDKIHPKYGSPLGLSQLGDLAFLSRRSITNPFTSALLIFDNRLIQ